MAAEQHTVLCVDDEPVGLEVRRMLLERAGYKVFTALDGPAGLEIFAREPIEAVVLDFSMPGMNGGEVASNMRGGQAKHPHSDVIRLHQPPSRSSPTCEPDHDER